MISSRPAPPGPVREFLQKNARTLDEIEDHILSTPTLTFAEDVGKGMGGPLPALLGVRSLQIVLLVRAGDALSRSGQERAQRSLQASWKHARSFDSQPDTLTQLLGIAVAGQQNAILRLWRAPAADWLGHVRGNDFRPRVLATYQATMYGWRSVATRHKGLNDLGELDGSPPIEDRMVDPALRFLSAPYVRLSLAGVSKEILRSRVELEHTDLCAFDPEEERAIKARFPRWNVLGPIMAPSPHTWAAVRDAMLDNEMTVRVMEARQAGHRPLGTVASEVCRDRAWVHEVTPDGRIRIHLEPAQTLVPRKAPWAFELQASR